MKIDVKFETFPVISRMKNPAKVRKAIKTNYTRAGKQCGAAIAASMRSRIRGGVGPDNAPMTKDIKGSSKPLVDTGRLFKSITYKVNGDYSNSIQIGVLRSAATANIARIVHEGARITVTKKMSILFKVLNAYTSGRKATLKGERAQELADRAKGIIPALREGTVLVIPPRPFAAETFADPKTRRIVETRFSEALQQVIRELSK